MRQTYVFACIHSYFPSISFSYGDIINVDKYTVYTSYLVTDTDINFSLTFMIVNQGLLNTKMFILRSKFRKWLLRFFFSKRFDGQGQRSTQ